VMCQGHRAIRPVYPSKSIELGTEDRSSCRAHFKPLRAKMSCVSFQGKTKVACLFKKPGPSLGPSHPGQQTAAGPPLQPVRDVAQGWSKQGGKQFLECNRSMQGPMSHFTTPPNYGLGCSLLSSSLGFLFLVGWGLVEQSSLKGNQSVRKSHLSLPNGLKAEGGTQAGPSCFLAQGNSRGLC
jgi:hypothetical protein